jgi:hypothetical protein
MATTLDPIALLSDAQETALANLKKAQDTALHAVKVVTDAVRPAVDALPAVPDFVEKLPKPAALVSTVGDFAEKLIATQREYVERLLGAVTSK